MEQRLKQRPEKFWLLCIEGCDIASRGQLWDECCYTISNPLKLFDANGAAARLSKVECRHW